MTTCGIYILWDNKDVSKFYFSKKMGGGGVNAPFAPPHLVMPLFPSIFLPHWYCGNCDSEQQFGHSQPPIPAIVIKCCNHYNHQYNSITILSLCQRQHMVHEKLEYKTWCIHNMASCFKYHVIPTNKPTSYLLPLLQSTMH